MLCFRQRFLHTNLACFLANEFSQNNHECFWGLVTQIANWRWLLTRNLLPAVLAFGLFFFITTKRRELNVTLGSTDTMFYMSCRESDDSNDTGLAVLIKPVFVNDE